MIRTTLWLLLVALLVTGCYTNVVAPGAKGSVVDAESGRPVQRARITRSLMTGGLWGAAPFATDEGLPAATVLGDNRGRFDLPPATHTDIAVMVAQNPKSISGSFQVTADGYATNQLQGEATSRSRWRVALGRVILKKQ